MQCISFLAFLVKGGKKSLYHTFSLLEGHRLSECLLDKPSGVTRVVHGEDTVCNLTRVPWDLFSAIAPAGHVSACVLPVLRPLGSLWHPVRCPSGGLCSPPQLHTRYRTRAPPEPWCWSSAASQHVSVPASQCSRCFLLDTLCSLRDGVLDLDQVQIRCE